jgi:hypothetical protein
MMVETLPLVHLHPVLQIGLSMTFQCQPHLISTSMHKAEPPPPTDISWCANDVSASIGMGM